MASDRSNLSRRQLLSIAGGTLGIVVTGTSRVLDHASATPQPGSPAATGPQAGTAPAENEVVDVSQQPSGPQLPRASEEALAMLGGVDVGTRFGQWTVAAIYDFHMGAVPVVLETAQGDRFQVDVLRRDPRPQAARGIGESRHLSFFLSNGGNGSTASSETQGLGLMALAATVRAREPRHLASTSLMSMEERAASYPRGVYKVPV